MKDNFKTFCMRYFLKSARRQKTVTGSSKAFFENVDAQRREQDIYFFRQVSPSSLLRQKKITRGRTRSLFFRAASLIAPVRRNPEGSLRLLQTSTRIAASQQEQAKRDSRISISLVLYLRS